MSTNSDMSVRTHKRDASLGSGVYFASEDYIGIVPRLFIWVVDLFVLIAACFTLGILFLSITGELGGLFFLICLAGVWAYLTVLKSSKIRTVGYRMTGCRIVNLRGERPSIAHMTFRLLLWVFGPFSGLFDLLWAGVDDDRQTLRDRFAGTCVVKLRAKPIGAAEIHLMRYNAFGFALMYPRVMRPQHVQPQT